MDEDAVELTMTHSSFVQKWAVVRQNILVRHELVHLGGHIDFQRMKRV